MSGRLRVLAVNKNQTEGEQWRNRFEASGYEVLQECLSLSSMVYILTQERVQLVICADNLIEEDAFVVLSAVQQHFPRVKIVIVGNSISKAYLFGNLSNVVVTKKLNPDLSEYYRAAPGLAFNADVLGEKSLMLLMDDHFLTDEEATVLMAKSFQWNPGYVVIGIFTEAYDENIGQILKKALTDYKYAYLLQWGLNEFYIILDAVPAVSFCIEVAHHIRSELLRETRTMFSIGISRLRFKAGELYACRKEAKRAAHAMHTFGQNSAIHIDYVDSGSIEYLYPDHKEKRLIEATMDGDTKYALQMLNEIFEVLRSVSGVKQSLVNKIVLRIIVGLNTAASARVSAFEKIELDSMSLKKLLSAKTVDEAYGFLQQGIHDFAGEMEAIMDVSRDALYYRLLKEKAKKEENSVLKAVQKLDTTMSFINAAIYKNQRSNIFSFLKD